MIHTAGEGDNVKHLAVVGGCSVIGLLCTMCVTNPLLSHPAISHLHLREMFNIFSARDSREKAYAEGFVNFWDNTTDNINVSTDYLKRFSAINITDCNVEAI